MTDAPLDAAAERRALRARILSLTWPVVLQNVARTLMLVVDTRMVRHLGTGALASMQMAGPLAHFLVEIFSALGIGAVATIARAAGEGDERKLRRTAAAALVVALVAGVVLVVPCVLWLPSAAQLYRSPGNEAACDGAARYLLAIAAAVPFLLLESAAGAAMRASGDSRTPFALALLGNAVNILGNWLLIDGHWGAPALGIFGAGVATAAGFAVQGLLGAALLFTGGTRIRLGFSDLAEVPREAYRSLARVAVPALVEPVLIRSGFLVFVGAITTLGEGATAAHRAAVTVESLSFMPGYGFSIACSAIVGQCLGAGRPDQAETALRESTKLAVLLMSLLGVVFLVAAGPLVAFFLPPTGADEATRLGALVLRIAAIEQPMLAAAMVLRGALRGAGDTRSSLVVGALCIWGIRVPLAWALAFPGGLGLVGIWITMIVDWTAQMLLFGWLVRRGRWKSLRF